MAKRAAKATKSDASAFDDLFAETSIKPQEPKKKNPKKPHFIIEGDRAKFIDAFAASDEVAKLVEANYEHDKTIAKEIVTSEFIKRCVESGTLLENPSIATTHSTMNFQAKHKSSVDFPKNNDGEEVTIDDLFGEHGFDQESIDEIKNHVVKVEKHFAIVPLSKLREGDETDKALCAKLSELIRDNFTAEERKRILVNNQTVSVDKSWADRAVKIACKDTEDIDKRAERLQTLLGIIPLSFVLTHAKTTISTDSVIKGWISGKDKEKSNEVIHQKYKAVIDGKLVDLYYCENGKETLLGRKECNDSGHAQASVKKWFRDESALKEQLDKWSKVA